jgi:benzoyl-CoA-dihydrodiol lyase
VLEHDKFVAQQNHWLAREIVLKWKRVLKRVDMTSRSIVTAGRARLVLRRHARELIFAPSLSTC